MKISLVFVTGLLSSTTSFTMPDALSIRRPLTQHHMFDGAGAGMPSEDNPEEMKMMEMAAKQMGMSLEEYKLGISARMKMVQTLDAVRVTAGSPDKVAVERDGNNPPKFLNIIISEEGKKLGKDFVSDELVKALKLAATSSRSSREEAQKTMMGYIGEEMKKMGKA